MKRYESETSARIRVFVPSFFVAQPSLDLPPPVPGCARPEDVLEKDPPPRFIVPWPSSMPPKSKHKEDIMDWGCNPHEPIPCEIDLPTLKTYLKKFPVEPTLAGIFKKCASGSSIDVSQIISSLEKPFSSGRENDDIIWTLDRSLRVDPVAGYDGAGPKKSSHKHQKLTRNADGWSIVSFVSGPPTRPHEADSSDKTAAVEYSANDQYEALAASRMAGEVPYVRKNLIYNEEGVAIAQVDFGHGTTVGTHAHSLAVDNLEHVAVSMEDHLFHFPTVPWPWMCIPIDNRYLVSEQVVKKFIRDFPAFGRTSTEILVPTVVRKAMSRATEKGDREAHLLQGLPAEVNPFAGHLPCDSYLTYRLPTTIDWDIYNEPSWRWLAVDLPFEDYSAASMGLGPLENS